MAGLSSPGSCGAPLGRAEETAGGQGGSPWPCLPPLTLRASEASLEGSHSLECPQTQPPTLPQVSVAGNTARAGLGGQWVGQSFLATSLFAPRAAQAGLGRAGGSRSQHSRGGLGGQASGKGMGKGVNPSTSRGIRSVQAESGRHISSF